ncbi:FAD/NAD(P)-binding domain-containing protein [Microthyrium microscopicum]|uniref:FAD/NAD(P)-binding domain-containing protein n=1 Tax=Microthyrium microscopicum TaxID=703497 RepID=A0A6A6UPW2_9PEZI|nr:FAD/NAD(P)-binding domain-containing protein [Microthyrium microscopicum]
MKPARGPAKIVILGGSYAGLSVAHQFLQKIIHTLGTTKTSPKYKVILVAPNTHLYWNIAGPRAICSAKLCPNKRAFVPFLPSFEMYPEEVFEFIQGEAISVDFHQRTIDIDVIPNSGPAAKAFTTKVEEPPGPKVLDFHALIIATGSAAHSDLLSLHGQHERTIEALDTFRAGLVTASSIIIVGGGASGVECAGQIATFVNRAKRKKAPGSNPKQSVCNKLHSLIRKDNAPAAAATPDGTNKPNTEPLNITLISGSERLLPNLDEDLGEKAEKMLKALGVHIMHNVRLISAQELPSRNTRCVLSDELTISCDLFIAATGTSPNTAFLPENLLDATGYVVVEPQFMRVPRAGDRVYAIGSCCAYDRKNILDVWAAVPVLLHNLRNDLWEWEIRVQNPYGGGEDKLEALQDVWFEPDERVTELCPITRWGGVGVLYDYKLPGLAVWFLKGRDYGIKKAKKVVAYGSSPFPKK